MTELDNRQKKFIKYHEDDIKNDNWSEFIMALYDNENQMDEFDTSDILKFIYYDCKVDFLKDIDFIPSYMFAYDEIKNLDFLKRYEHIDRIHSSAFSCSALEIVNIPDHISIIGDWAFSDCNNIKEIYLPKSLSFIGDYMFENSMGIEKVYVPKNVKDNFYKSNAYHNIKDFNDSEFIEV